MKVMNRRSGWLALVLLLAAGCYPHGADFVEDYDVVYTNYNSNFNFKSKTKYAIPNKIVKMTGNAITGDPPKYVPDLLAGPMLARMESNMSALGYTKVDISQSPDLILAPAAIET